MCWGKWIARKALLSAPVGPPQQASLCQVSFEPMEWDWVQIRGKGDTYIYIFFGHNITLIYFQEKSRKLGIHEYIFQQFRQVTFIFFSFACSHLIFIFFEALFFLRLRAVLTSQQIEREVQSFLIYSLPPHLHNLPHHQHPYLIVVLFFFYLFYFILFYFFICSEFCHTLKWNSHGFTCVPHPDPAPHLPLYPIPLGLPSAPGPSACLMHLTWAGDLFHPR